MPAFNVYKLLNRTPMPEGVRLRLWRHFLEREYEKERKQATEGGNDGQVWFDGSNWQYDFAEIENDEARYHSRQLIERARKLRIPRPPLMVEAKIAPDWERSDLDGSFLLSLIGEQNLRAAIRQEEKHRSERWARRIPYLTALSGLIGTITGLVAVLQKWWL